MRIDLNAAAPDPLSGRDFRPPRLGPGIVYQSALRGLCLAHPDLIQTAEIEPQTMWTRATGQGALPRGSALRLQELSGLPQNLLLHGIGSPVGGTINHGAAEQREFVHWARRLKSPWTSEHLSILEVEGRSEHQTPCPRSCGFLMPPLQTEAQIALAVDNIRSRVQVTGLPFAFETGVNYFEPRKDELPDGAFFAAVAAEADCGILLDLSNLCVNQRNGRDRIEQILRCLPHERVWEMHLSGLEFAHGAWLDAHGGAIDDELVALACDLARGFPNLGAIIFEIAADRLPSFGDAAVLREVERLHQIWECVPSLQSVPPNDGVAVAWRRLTPTASPMPDPKSWEGLIAAKMLPAECRLPPTGITPCTNSDDATFRLYNSLVTSFRRGAICDLLNYTIRLLLLALGNAGVEELFDAFSAQIGPSLFASDEALAFSSFLIARRLDIPGLGDVVLLEATIIQAVADSQALRISVTQDFDVNLAAIESGRIPSQSDQQLQQVIEIGGWPDPSIRVVGV